MADSVLFDSKEQVIDTLLQLLEGLDFVAIEALPVLRYEVLLFTLETVVGDLMLQLIDIGDV